MADYDAIIIGAGHNGLVCAAYMARAGWRVLVVEQADEIGGGLRSGEVTLPGFHHDRYATNIGLFAGSPIYAELRSELEAHGVRLLRSERPYASLHGPKVVRVFTDLDRTLECVRAINGADAEGWHRLVDFYRRVAPLLQPLFFTEMPSLALMRCVAKLVSECGVRDTARLARLIRQSSCDFAESFVRSPEMTGVIEAWGYHLDFAPYVKGGALFAFVSAMSGQVYGMPLVQGGAGRISTALGEIIKAAKGRVVTGTEVTNVVVRNSRAAAVRTIKGEEISASRAIVANVTTRNLFCKLVDANELPMRFLGRSKAYRYGPGTFIVHLALDRLPQWCGGDDLSTFSYVHINGNEVEIDETYRQSLAGNLPSRPLLVVSQTTFVDPSRAPPGKHIMRIHARTVPAVIRGDAAGIISARSWVEAKEPFAERIIDLVEENAPDLRDCIIAKAAETPEEIERANPNFVGADCVSGSHQFDQNFICRPMLGWSNYRTPIDRLFMIGASTWPGGGINGGSGYLLARQLIERSSRALAKGRSL
jgi:phytoene dehydrogenase-like protein